MHYLLKLSSSDQQILNLTFVHVQTVIKQYSGCPNDMLDSLVAKPLLQVLLILKLNPLFPW